ncbi:MAG: molybdate ABC transporter substrate-binding protein [Micrococcales bacterium]|nr:molybdate ABC transporter substrate-binding protein [Micrococcales bacterium]
MRGASAATGAVAALALLAGCAGAAPAPSRSPASAANLTGSVTVFAAASLTATFTILATDFEKANPGVTVRTSFAGSGILLTQIQQGAPADVFAAADTRTMQSLADGGALAGAATDFATNTLEVATPPDNPAGIRTFADLARPGVKTVICQAAQPCGAAAAAVQKAAGVTLAPVSEEPSVSAVLTAVTTGLADAGLVYRTDVRGAGAKVRGIEFAESDRVVNTYPIAVLKGTRNAAAARAFVGYVTGAPGRKLLRAAGFGSP